MAEIILLVALGFSILIGILAGGGKVLKRLTNGIIGKILTFVVFYFTFCIVLSFPISQRLLLLIAEKINSIDSKVLTFIFLKMRLELIIFAIIFFFIIVLLRKLIVCIISSILEKNNKFMKVLNKILGVLLSIVWLAILVLIVFQILAWTTGVHGSVYQQLQGSFLRLDKLFVENPLNSLISSIDIKRLLVTN